MLVLLPRLPSLAENPADVRLRQFLAAMKQAGFRSHLVAMRGAGQTTADEVLCAPFAASLASFDPPNLLPLRRAKALLGGRSMTVASHQSAALADHVEGMGGAKRFDAAVAFGGAMAEYVPKPLGMRILDLGVPESSLIAARAAAEFGPRRWSLSAEARLLEAVELKHLLQWDVVVFGSQVNAIKFKKMYPKKHIIAVHDGLSVGPRPNRDAIIRFAARAVMRVDFTHQAYAADVRRFLDEVWPAALNLRRDAELMIVAHRPPAWVRGRERQRVHVVEGFDGMAKELGRSLMFLSPWSVPRGMSNTVSEAMASGIVPVVSAAVAAGLPAVLSHHVVTAKNSEQWITTIDRLLTDRVQAYGMICRSQDAIAQHGTPEVVWKPVMKLLEVAGTTSGRNPHFKRPAA